MRMPSLEPKLSNAQLVSKRCHRLEQQVAGPQKKCELSPKGLRLHQKLPWYQAAGSIVMAVFQGSEEVRAVSLGAGPTLVLVQF